MRKRRKCYIGRRQSVQLPKHLLNRYRYLPIYSFFVNSKKKVCGAAGSAWKMYISPIHAVMVLHNVETNEEIWDYKATDPDLLRVVEGNIIGLAGIKAKARAAEEREQEWEKLTMNRYFQQSYHDFQIYTGMRFP